MFDIRYEFTHSLIYISNIHEQLMYVRTISEFFYVFYSFGSSLDKALAFMN